jgi:hypothetical protein
MKVEFLIGIIAISTMFCSCEKLGYQGNDYCKSCEAINIVSNEAEASYENCEATLSTADAARPVWKEKYYNDSIYRIKCTNNW